MEQVGFSSVRRGSDGHACAYEIYLAVFRRVTDVLNERHEVTREFELFSKNLDALIGAPRMAAAFAKLDAQAERTAREMDVICLAVCDAPCELHPDQRH